MWRIFLAVAAVVATACTGASAGPATVDTQHDDVALARRPADPTTTEPSSIEAAVLDAVDGFGRSTITVNDPPDPDHPDLARYRTGDVLTNAIGAVTSNENLGIAYRLAPGSSYRHLAAVIQLTDVTALVHDCVVDAARQVAVADGRVLNDVVATKLFATRLVMSDGTWKVSDNQLVERWEGEAGCAAAGSS